MSLISLGEFYYYLFLFGFWSGLCSFNANRLVRPGGGVGGGVVAAVAIPRIITFRSAIKGSLYTHQQMLLHRSSCGKFSFVLAGIQCVGSGWTTCSSSVESRVSGLVLPLRTIRVLVMNPDAESTSTSSGWSPGAPGGTMSPAPGAGQHNMVILVVLALKVPRAADRK